MWAVDSAKLSNVWSSCLTTRIQNPKMGMPISQKFRLLSAMVALRFGDDLEDAAVRHSPVKINKRCFNPRRVPPPRASRAPRTSTRHGQMADEESLFWGTGMTSSLE